MDGTTLQHMREAYGVTQEALAAELDVSVRTLRRWETPTARASLVNSTRIGRALCAIGKCHKDRAAQYGSVMVDQKILTEVKYNPAIVNLYWGREFLLLEVSEGSRRAWGPLEHFKGSEIAALLMGDMRK